MDRKIEDIFKAMYPHDLPKDLKYLILEIAGDKGDAAALMPLCQYNL